jgi:hypothetical protein
MKPFHLFVIVIFLLLKNRFVHSENVVSSTVITTNGDVKSLNSDDVQREDLVRSLQMKLAETEKHHEKAKLTLSNAIRKIAQFENKIK